MGGEAHVHGDSGSDLHIGCQSADTWIYFLVLGIFLLIVRKVFMGLKPYLSQVITWHLRGSGRDTPCRAKCKEAIVVTECSTRASVLAPTWSPAGLVNLGNGKVYDVSDGYKKRHLRARMRRGPRRWIKGKQERDLEAPKVQTRMDRGRDLADQAMKVRSLPERSISLLRSQLRAPRSGLSD